MNKRDLLLFTSGAFIGSILLRHTIARAVANELDQRRRKMIEQESSQWREMQRRAREEEARLSS